MFDCVELSLSLSGIPRASRWLRLAGSLRVGSTATAGLGKLLLVVLHHMDEVQVVVGGEDDIHVEWRLAVVVRLQRRVELLRCRVAGSHQSFDMRLQDALVLLENLRVPVSQKQGRNLVIHILTQACARCPRHQHRPRKSCDVYRQT